jgi:CyaY protein
LGSVNGPFWPQAAKAVKMTKTSKEPTTGIDIGWAATLVWRCNIRSILSAMTASPDTLSDSEYRDLTSAVLAGVEATVDQWLQDDVVDIDTHRTGGLLELSFPNGSKIVLNTQPPLHELWLAARSGGFHFRCVQGRWADTRDGREFFDALSACASEQAGRPLRFGAPLSA